MPDEPRCVYCRMRPVDRRFRPFCSERCKMADLGRWLSGDYCVPVRQGQDSETDIPDGVPRDADDEP